MKKGLILCVFLTSAFFFASAGNSPFPVNKLPKSFTIPTLSTEMERPVGFYVLNTCNGFQNEFIEGKGKLSISVQGDIRNGKAALRVKIAYNGEAKSTLGYSDYTINSSSCLLVSQYITQPTDIFLQEPFKLVPTGNTPSLYLGNLGYIRVYPDGNVEYHILENDNFPENSSLTLNCQSPKGKR